MRTSRTLVPGEFEATKITAQQKVRKVYLKDSVKSDRDQISISHKPSQSVGAIYPFTDSVSKDGSLGLLGGPTTQTNEVFRREVENQRSQSRRMQE